MNIGEAIQAVKAGKVVSRAAWGPGVRVGCNPQIGVYVRTVDGRDVPWTPSTEDWFAEDWGLGDPINHPGPMHDGKCWHPIGRSKFNPDTDLFCSRPFQHDDGHWNEAERERERRGS